MVSPTLNAALKYHERGWRVMPLVGKKPIITGWHKDGALSPDILLGHGKTLSRWFEDGANIGICTGPESGLLVLDIDGAEGERWLSDNGFAIPQGPQVRTAKGRHLYFQYPQGIPVKNAVRVAPAIDVRSAGGQVVAPPSRHPDTGAIYEWAEGTESLPLPECPARLLDAIIAGGKHHKAQSQDTAIRESVFSEGERNDRLFETGCSLRRNGANPGVISDTLSKINAEQCVPPLPDSEVMTIARQATKYQPGGSQSHSVDVSECFFEPERTEPPDFGDEGFESFLETEDNYNLVNFGYERNDSGNAQRLIDAHGEDIRYCHLWRKWLAWDGHRWDEGATHIVTRHAEDVVSKMLQDALAIPKTEDKAADTERRAAIGFAKASGNSARIRAMMELAQAGYLIPVEPERFDQNKFLLNCDNGTLDLKTGELRTFERADYLTRVIGTEYLPDAKCPLWERFLLQIMDGRAHLVDFIQRVIGYCLTGDTSEQCMFILHGGGSNGKSTLLGVLQNILGSYGKAAESQLFIEKRSDNAAFYALASLWGARLVTSIETGEGRKLDEPLVKQATGGDVITCRRMREDFWEYTPEFKLFLATNHRPTIKGTDNAIWRRIRLIPFEVTISDAQKDYTLKDKLFGEAPGILAWAVRGCLDWQRSGLREPSEVLAATEDYRHEQDVLGAFLDECCLVGPGRRDTVQNIYQTYTRWAKENGSFVWSCKKLMGDLATRGFDECWHMRARGRDGLAVKPGWEYSSNPPYSPQMSQM
jgi:putative DNA primase/helicase